MAAIATLVALLPLVPADSPALALDDPAPAASGGSPSPDSLRALAARAQAGDAGAQLELGWCYADGKGVPPSDSLAVTWFRRAAAQGDLDAQFTLASFILQGRGAPRDPSAAADLMRRAAEVGHSASQFWMAALNYRDWKTSGGVAERDEFLRWLRASGAQGFPAAEFTLGSIHRSGDGVPQDSALAVQWLTAAARDHSSEAQAMLAVMYRGKEWEPASKVETSGWFREAAEQGSVDAQFSLALLLSDCTPLGYSLFTVGVAKVRPEDRVGACMWLSVAEARGDPEAGVLLAILERDVPATELAEARTRAQDWLSRHPAGPRR